MYKSKIVAGALSVASAAVMALSFVPAANASSTAIRVGFFADRSVSHRLVYVRAFVVCSEDTTSAALTATVSQVSPAGTIQTASSLALGLGSVECTGEQELVKVPVRIPIGGYKWHAGAAAVDCVIFATDDPSGTYYTQLPKRTVLVR
jgi:hypothetical protein